MLYHLDSVTSLDSHPSSDTLPFTASPGIQVDLERQDPIDFFLLFFDEKVFNLIYEQTQLYIRQYSADNKEFLDNHDNHPHAQAHELKKHPLMEKDSLPP